MTGHDGPHWLPARLLQDVQMSGRHSPVPVRPKNGFCTHPVSRNFTMARIQLVFPQHLQAKHHMLIYLVTSSPPLLLQIHPMSSLCRSYHSGRQYFNIMSYHVFPQIQQCWVHLKNRQDDPSSKETITASPIHLPYRPALPQASQLQMYDFPL